MLDDFLFDSARDAPVQKPKLARTRLLLPRLLPVTRGFLGGARTVERIGMHVGQMQETSM